MIPSGEISIPQEASEQKFTYEEIEGLLAEFNQKGIFGTLRAEQQEPRSFFNPEQSYIAEDDESPVGTVFDMYREALLKENPVATRNYYTDEARKNMIGALEPGSKKRMILMAYYGISEDMPWNEASGIICSRQTYKSDNFPQYGTVTRILEKLEKPNNHFESSEFVQEKLLEALRLQVEKDPQKGVEFGGFITLKGPLESVRKVLLAMTELGGYDEGSGWKHAAQNALRKSLEDRINMDMDVLGEDGEKKMVRVISFPVKPDGSIEVSLGGGGNRTKFSEMNAAFEEGLTQASEVDKEK